MNKECVGCICINCIGCEIECSSCQKVNTPIKKCDAFLLKKVPLQEMFDKQKMLQNRLFNNNLPEMTPSKLPITITSIVAELGEILEEVQDWKDWKKNPKPINKANLDTEIADVWHFIINLSLYLGYDATEIYEVFMAKNATNHTRQDNNY